MECLQTNNTSASFPLLPGQARSQDRAPSFQLVEHPPVPLPSPRPSAAGSLTVQLLDALEVILRQLEVLCVHPLVEGGHDSTGVAGMFQAQRVPQLVHGHQEKVVPCRERHCQQGSRAPGMGQLPGPSTAPCARDAPRRNQSNLRHPQRKCSVCPAGPARHTSPRCRATTKPWLLQSPCHPSPLHRLTRHIRVLQRPGLI